MKIWVLFVIYNNYDQPDHNLKAWWMDKPDVHKVVRTLHGGNNYTPEDYKTARLLLEKRKMVDYHNDSYRLVTIKEGIITENGGYGG